MLESRSRIVEARYALPSRNRAFFGHRKTQQNTLPCHGYLLTVAVLCMRLTCAALRLLAHERPTLWRVAQLHAALDEMPERQGRIADWYKTLSQHEIAATRHKCMIDAQGSVIVPAPPRKRGAEVAASHSFYFPRSSRRSETKQNVDTLIRRPLMTRPHHRKAPVAISSGKKPHEDAGLEYGTGRLFAAERFCHERLSLAAEHAAAAADRGDAAASPLLGALLSNAEFAGTAYPKPPAVQPTALATGVWSADFSWRRGDSSYSREGAGAAAASPIAVGDAELCIASREPVQVPPRLTLSIGAVAPFAASISAPGSARCAPALIESGTAKSARQAIANTERCSKQAESQHFGCTPFGKRTAVVGISGGVPTPSPTRYDIPQPPGRRAPVVNVGIGGTVRRISSSNSTGASSDRVGPGTYSPRHNAIDRNVASAKVKGRVVTDECSTSVPGPGTYTPSETSEATARVHTFSRASTARPTSQSVNEVRMGASTGLFEWRALVPALIKAGAMQPPSGPSALERARATIAKGTAKSNDSSHQCAVRE